MKKLIPLTLAAMLLAGCGTAPTALMGNAASGGADALAARRGGAEGALQTKLSNAQSKFIQLAQTYSTRQGLGDNAAAYQGMAAAMQDMAELHTQLAALKTAQSDELSQAEAALYADVAATERQVLAEGPQKKGALGKLRDTFWEVVNKLATKPTQYYFNHPHGKPDPNAPKLARFGDAELAQILKVAQPGDILLWGGQTSFVHGSIYLGNGEIVHALANNTPAGPDAQGVFRETIKGYMARVERNRVVVMRVKAFDSADDQATMAYALKQLGKPYDNVFRTTDEAAFYCTELVYHAVEQTAHAPAIGSRKKVMGLFNVVTTDDIRLSADLETLWSKNAPDPVPAAQ